jgi:hypothetical protein
MSKRDVFHDEAKNALIKDGWTITDDPFSIRYDDVDMFADLGAEKLLAAEKGAEKIVVEIKSFVEGSLVSQFHTAVGQFLDYRIALEETEPERVLFLAVPLDAYHTFFRKRLAQTVIQQFDIKVMVFDVTKEEIVTWIK